MRKEKHFSHRLKEAVSRKPLAVANLFNEVRMNRGGRWDPQHGFDERLITG
jgi:hypothetical protein